VAVVVAKQLQLAKQPMCLIGLAMLQDNYSWRSFASSFKLLAITIMLFILNPTLTFVLVASLELR